MASYTVTWNNTNERFEGDDGETIEHNGTTWVLNVPDESISNCTASIDSEPVGSHIDPASSDITWSCGASITASGGVAGDPHIKPIFGKPYTI